MNQLYANLNYLISKNVFENKYIALFGANKTSDLTRSYLGSNKIDVSAVIDNNEEKSGKTLAGINIFTPRELFDNFNGDKKNVLILIASVFYKEMKRSVYKYGFDDTNFIQTLYFAEYSISENAFSKGVNTVMDGFEVYERIKAAYGGDAFIILNPCPSIGDSVFILSFLDAYLQKNQIENYVYVITGGAAEKVAKLFGNIRYKMISQYESDALLAFYSFMKPPRFTVASYAEPHFNTLLKFYGKGRLNWGDMIREIVLGLKRGDNITLAGEGFSYADGRLSRVSSDFLSENGIVEAKTAIIAASAVQAESLPDIFWLELKYALEKKGFTALFNVAAGESINIKGAKSLFIPLDKVVGTVQKAGVFIGLRSGLCDLVSFARCKKFFIYPDSDFYDFYGLNNIGLLKDNDNIEIIYDGCQKTINMITERF